jgi:hypothetical protein
MKCKHQKKVENFHVGEISKEDLSFLREHLKTCVECKEFLGELKYNDQVLAAVKSFKPTLNNPVAFRKEILDNIKPRKSRSVFNELSKMLDTLIFILVQPATRYSFITAALFIFGVFIYQQTIIVQKIGSLEKRMETAAKSGDIKSSSLKNVEAFFKKRSGVKTEDKEFNELLDDYRTLQIHHKVLLKVLKERYPEIYRDIMKELEEEDLMPENINI